MKILSIIKTFIFILILASCMKLITLDYILSEFLTLCYYNLNEYYMQLYIIYLYIFSHLK